MGRFHNGLMGFCVLWVRPVLTFKTRKYVVIQDWRLGLLLRLVQCGILGYVLWSIFQVEGYLITQVPSGGVQVFTEGSENYTVKAMQEAFTTKQHCTQPHLYNFYYNQRFTYRDFKCVIANPNGFSKKMGNSIQIVTYILSGKEFSKPGSSISECEAYITNNSSSDGVPNNAKLLDLINGNCFFVTEDHIFMAIPEKMNLTFSHRFSTSSQIGFDAVLPPTYLRDISKKKVIKEWKKGVEVNELLSTWMEWAELNLDLPMNEQPAHLKGEAPIAKNIAQKQNTINQGLNITLVPEDENILVYPRLRLSGVTLAVKLQYYNWRLSPLKKDIQNSADNFHCVMDIKPILGWKSFGQDIHYALRDFQDPRYISNVQENKNFTDGYLAADMYRYGIDIVFEASGIIGKFEVTQLIQSITSGIVLLAFANTIVTMIALYGRGIQSKMYGELIYDKVDWRQEYARFAAQAVVGAYVFNLIDTHQTGTLNGTEIYAVLRTLFGHRMTSGELASVVDFVLTNGDDESDKRLLQRLQNKVDKTNISENEITLDEWMHIFGTSKASIDTMIRAIESEYKSEKPRVTPEMRNAQPAPAFQGLQQGIFLGDSFHTSGQLSDPVWKEMEISSKSNNS